MASNIPRELLMAAAPRVIDLRSEFEAQLRAVTRLEEQLAKSGSANGAANQELSDALRRELGEMINNNRNIRDVLVELAAVTGVGASVG